MKSEALKSKLACPVCKYEGLEFKESEVLCLACHNSYPIEISDNEKIFNFIPNFNSKYINPVERLWQYLLGTSSQSQEQGMLRYDSFAGFDETFSTFKIEGSCVLDIGGHSGVLRRYLKNSEYVCLEPALDAYRRRSILGELDPELGKPFNFIRGVGEYLPFKSGSFDSVVMWGMIEHLFNLNLAISEVHRVLRPGGKFYIAADFKGLRSKIERNPLPGKIKKYLKNFGFFRTLKRSFEKIIFSIRQKFNPWQKILNLSHSQIEAGHIFDDLNHQDMRFLAYHFGFQVEKVIEFDNNSTVYILIKP